MTDINCVNLIGRLTRDIGENDFSYLNSGTARLSFSVAVNRSVKKNEQWVDEVSYFDVVYWGKAAEAIKPYIGKGKQIGINGYLKQDRWEKDGEKKSRITIVADSVQLLGGKSESKNENISGSNNNSGFIQKQQMQNNAPAIPQTEEFPEDIPF